MGLFGEEDRDPHIFNNLQRADVSREPREEARLGGAQEEKAVLLSARRNGLVHAVVHVHDLRCIPEVVGIGPLGQFVFVQSARPGYR